MTAPQLAEQFRLADQHIKAGQIEAAAHVLSRLPSQYPLKKWPPSDLHTFSELCRRSDLFSLGLRSLAPLIRGDKGQLISQKVEWTVTYAGLLIKIGSLAEAIQLLESCRPRTPDCDLYTAYAFLAEWDYVHAQMCLEKFLAWPDVPEYRHMVGQVNLAAALLKNSQWLSAEKLLLEIQRTCRKKDWQLLLRNSFELRTELAVETGDVQLADEQIRESERFSSRDRYNLHLAVHKVRLAIKRRAQPGQIENELAQIRKQAMSIHNYETIRSVDSILAELRRDPKLADQVYFGTPYRAFQQRFRVRTAEWYEPSSQFTWKLGGDGAPAAKFDVFHGTGADEDLKTGQATHRLLSALSRDFFRPVPIGLLHGHLFPGQYLNPLTSPQRIANVINRAREWLKDALLPLQIGVERGQFFLQASEPVALVLHLAHRSTPEERLGPLASLEKLKPAIEETFTAAKVRDALQVSLRSANNLIKWGCDNKVLVKFGAGRATRYKFSA